MSLNEVKRTERGWAGHFILSSRCRFRRNTLLEYGDIKIVVSTIGNMFSITNNGYEKYEQVGLKRDYETYVFFADNEDPYHDIIAERQLFEFDRAYEIKKGDKCCDLIANNMHEEVVAEVTEALLKGEIHNVE